MDAESGPRGRTTCDLPRGETPGPPHPLRDQTLGIVGFGRIGRRVAEKACGFGLRLLATDKALGTAVGEPEGVAMTDLDTLHAT